MQYSRRILFQISSSLQSQYIPMFIPCLQVYFSSQNLQILHVYLPEIVAKGLDVLTTAEKHFLVYRAGINVLKQCQFNYFVLRL